MQTESKLKRYWLLLLRLTRGKNYQRSDNYLTKKEAQLSELQFFSTLAIMFRESYLHAGQPR